VASIKHRFATALLLFASALSAAGAERLQVAPDGRTLQTVSGTPFTWIGDTAWNLFVQLDLEESERYLQDRRDKRFTVIQANIASLHADALNHSGQPAFHEQDYDRPNEAYFRHIDQVLARAEELDIYVLLLPAWARTHIERDPTLTSPEKARRYGEFLGRRYRERNNIIWCLGGDARPTKHTIYDALAKGIEAGLGYDPLMTYHPPGGTYRPPATSTGEFYHDKPWLDFNMMQSGHSRGNRNYLRVEEDYARTPVKPTIDSEPCYEQHPIRHKFENGVFNSWDVRQRAYWSVLAGAFGFSYGGNGIWQMDKPGDVLKETHFSHFWYDALDHEGAQQLRHLHWFLETYPRRVPDQSLLLSDSGDRNDRLQAARTPDSRTILVYSTNGRAFRVRLPAEQGTAEWFNPRDGSRTDAEWKTDQNPPGPEGDSRDWLLILTASPSGKSP